MVGVYKSGIAQHICAVYDPLCSDIKVVSYISDNSVLDEDIDLFVYGVVFVARHHRMNISQ